MVSKKLWIAAGAAVVAVALGVVTAYVIVPRVAAAAAGPIELTASVDCSPDDRITSTVTWTLENHRDHPATVAQIDGPGEGSLTSKVYNEVVPAAQNGLPGTLTFTQITTGTATTALSVSTAWDDDAPETSTPEVTVEGVDCRTPVPVGELTVTQPDCDAADPGLDGTLLIEGADAEIGFEVEVTGGEATEVLYPDEPFTVLVDAEPVTVVVTPLAHDDVRLEGYTPSDWVVTFAPVTDECS
ncbi:hypothetical protein [Microbacterium sp.]|uniref:hypothetical protein n=1 Tax=Microbacterium sp. TaxID=51671 RepID=UPI0027376CAB|nr:hypothetical protein [Microbacterium sp.]MDP3952091.1 hypothetical protein [Microbacterium sp.]